MCSPGFELIKSTCQDIDECLKNPCPTNAVCGNNEGSFTCNCVNGTVFETETGSCKSPGQCVTDGDCPEETKCNDNYCINPCDYIKCGKGAKCIVIKHEPICQCEPDSEGDPYTSCTKLQCTKDLDCPDEEACSNNKCINSCSLPRACGKNANCISRSHIGQCSCDPGFTGDPVLGCAPIQFCQFDNNRCPGGTKCVDNVCLGKGITIISLFMSKSIISYINYKLTNKLIC